MRMPRTSPGQRWPWTAVWQWGSNTNLLTTDLNRRVALVAGRDEVWANVTRLPWEGTEDRRAVNNLDFTKGEDILQHPTWVPPILRAR